MYINFEALLNTVFKMYMLIINITDTYFLLERFEKYDKGSLRVLRLPPTAQDHVNTDASYKKQ